MLVYQSKLCSVVLWNVLPHHLDAFVSNNNAPAVVSTFPTMIRLGNKVVSRNAILSRNGTWAVISAYSAHSGAGSKCVGVENLNASMCSVVLGWKILSIITEKAGDEANTEVPKNYPLPRAVVF